MREELLKIGFKEQEANIFQSCLHEAKSGPSLAKELSLNRRTIYDICEKLHHQGYMKKQILNGTQLFKSQSPKLIAKELNQIAAELNTFKETKPTTPELNILKGSRSLLQAANSALETKSEVLVMGRGGLLLDQLKEAKYQFIPRMEKISWRMIQTPDYKNNLFKPKKIKVIKKKLETGFIVYDDTVLLLANTNDLQLIEIKDQAFANTYKIYFEMFWSL